MGRGCRTYSMLFIAGILAGHLLTPSFIICATLLALSIPIMYKYRRKGTAFIAVSHIAIFIAGAGSLGLALGKGDLPPDKFTGYITSKAAQLQEAAGAHLSGFVSTEQRHATLCALTVGMKKNMDPALRKGYSAAGAMHLLALSGLHAGIVYTIFETLLIPLKVLPGGQVFQLTMSMIFLLIYMTASGCSPSVVRACTMIFLYRISAKRFRETRNWDAIAISALIIGTFSPLQVTSIGFQLSYAAVIGIAALYPVCRRAFIQYAAGKGACRGIAYRTALKLWESISISVCCQIATLPFLLYYFGEGAQFFLITNLLAIPLVTCILYLTVMALITQWIPLAGQLLAEVLDMSVGLLNSFIMFISG